MTRTEAPGLASGGFGHVVADGSTLAVLGHGVHAWRGFWR